MQAWQMGCSDYSKPLAPFAVCCLADNHTFLNPPVAYTAQAGQANSLQFSSLPSSSFQQCERQVSQAFGAFCPLSTQQLIAGGAYCPTGSFLTASSLPQSYYFNNLWEASCSNGVVPTISLICCQAFASPACVVASPSVCAAKHQLSIAAGFLTAVNTGLTYSSVNSSSLVLSYGSGAVACPSAVPSPLR